MGEGQERKKEEGKKHFSVYRKYFLILELKQTPVAKKNHCFVIFDINSILSTQKDTDIKSTSQ